MKILYKATVKLGEKSLEASFESDYQMDQRTYQDLLMDALTKQFKVVFKPDVVFSEENK